MVERLGKEAQVPGSAHDEACRVPDVGATFDHEHDVGGIVRWHGVQSGLGLWTNSVALAEMVDRTLHLCVDAGRWLIISAI